MGFRWNPPFDVFSHSIKQDRKLRRRQMPRQRDETDFIDMEIEMRPHFFRVKIIHEVSPYINST